MVLKMHRDVNGLYPSFKQSISLIQLEEKQTRYISEDVQ